MTGNRKWGCHGGEDVERDGTSHSIDLRLLLTRTYISCLNVLDLSTGLQEWSEIFIRRDHAAVYLRCLTNGQDIAASISTAVNLCLSIHLFRLLHQKPRISDSLIGQRSCKSLTFGLLHSSGLRQCSTFVGAHPSRADDCFQAAPVEVISCAASPYRVDMAFVTRRFRASSCFLSFSALESSSSSSPIASLKVCSIFSF
jgi:hypothetical protein